jgi:AraC family transcriptional regulator of arabinose operon
MADYGLAVVAGGFYRCDRHWTQEQPAPASWQRIYIPVSGRARFALAESWTELVPGQLYLIPAHGATRQWCADEMRVWWMHVVVEAPALAQQVARLGAIRSWPEAQWRWARPLYERIGSQLAGGTVAHTAALHAFALAVLAAGLGDPADPAPGERLRGRFAPALALIERQHPHAVPAAALARVMGMSVVHFRRSFRQAFGLPPHAYASAQRMELAAGLLAEGGQSVARVAAACGYPDEFYFSRVFKRHHQVSPSSFRRRRLRVP